MNIPTRNEDGQLDRVDSYIGVPDFGFSSVGSAEDLSAPGGIFPI